jgi:hypothetical protein
MYYSNVCKRTNSKCVCEIVNINAILIVITLYRLPLLVALKLVVVCCCSVPAFCTAEDEGGEDGTGITGKMLVDLRE